MDEFGSITIDNQNLLDDLLGLAEQSDQPTSLSHFQSKYLDISNVQGRKVFLESPTFTKGEDDIYRYVHSRMSTLEPSGRNNNNNPLLDSLDTNQANFLNNTSNNNNNNNNYTYNNGNYYLNKQGNSHAQRIGSNRLLSDIAVASLNKNNAPSQLNNEREILDEQLYENNLLDSLDTNRNKNKNPPTKQYQAYANNLNHPGSVNNSTINLQSQPFLIQQQQQQQHLAAQAQFQPIIPIQAAVPQPGLFTILPSPTSNSLPIVQTQLQFQPHPQPPQATAAAIAHQQPHFIQIPIQQQQQQPQQQQQQQQQFLPAHANMFYQEPLQPMFYNTAYPINFGGAPAANFYQPPQQDFSQNDFIYEESDDFYDQQYSNNQMNNYQNQTSQKYQPKVNKNKVYDAQPLQQPPLQASQRSNNNNNNQLYYPYSQQSNESYDTPVPYNEQDDAEFNNEFASLKVNNSNENKTGVYHSNRVNELNEEDLKRQQVWNKLQKEREMKNKNGSSGAKSKPGNNGLPPVPVNNNNKNMAIKKTPTNIVEKKDNFLEKNIEAIRNKENLVHRYPNKKYEAIHGKNADARIKSIQGTPTKKPPHHLQPIENYEDDEQPEQVEQNQKMFKLNLNSADNSFANQKISIPLDTSAFRDKDHINLDINLRLVDFLNAGGNRSMDDFNVNNDPLGRHIKQFETNMSRSLPGSSGSLNKHTTLPPLGRQGQPTDNKRTGQHSHDAEFRSEDGYLVQLQKSQNKPVIKTYTLKDYRNFKKDMLLSNNNTGKLGPDFESDHYRQKIEITQRKNDYAERVKARNRMLLLNEGKNEDDESSIKSPPQPQSKTNRAKEYVKNNVLRPRSASRSIPTRTSDNDNPDSSRQRKPAPKPQETRSNETSIIRIRDPVTSKVRTLYLNDAQIDELSRRHEQDRNKVNTLINNNNNNNPNNNKNVITDINNNNNKITQIVAKPKQPVVLERSKIMEEYEKQEAAANEEDDEFQKLLERHDRDKRKVNEIKTNNNKEAQFFNQQSELNINEIMT